ncbi:hypothetical protein DC20_01945 [Rufibacter tibetensis]|uniref:Ig-like domain-containing protein n=1 Tax=Rufibacter tibetensis TaxID=512763 RepID=A0A0P0C4C8_9BACT|nr:hypothetical protein DC20_01945 [Rufibacter tibetensis]
MLFLFTAIPSSAQFVTKGDAVQISSTCYKITPDEEYRFGTIFWKDKIDLSKPFELSFIAFLGTRDQQGADGIGFVFHNDPTGFDARGNSAAGLGFGYDELHYTPDKAIVPSVAIEFDTYDNGPENGDIPADHTTVVYNGQTNRPKFPPVLIDPNNEDVENNTCHTYTITWNPATQKLQLYFDEQLRFSHQDDLIRNVFKGSKEVYYGFTGSTGDKKNEQTICIIDAGSKPVAVKDQATAVPLLPSTINVAGNDFHTKREPISVSQIITQPKNGSASLLNNQVVYTANRNFTGVDSLQYEVCESSSDLCYTKCATAWVQIQVSCPPMPQPELEANGELSICAGEGVELIATKGENNLYQWWKDDQRIGGVVSSNTLEAKETGTYWAELTNTCGAKVLTNKVVVSKKELQITPLTSSVSRCGPGSVTIEAFHKAADKYRWYDAPTSTKPIAENTSGVYKTPDLKVSTTYYVSLLENGCESSRVPVKAIIKPLPVVKVGPNVTIGLDKSIVLRASGGVSYLWSPPTGLSDASSPTPTARPLETTTYTVKVTDAQGCQNQASVTVTVSDNLIIPTAFSPNGDGTNETWEITNMLNYPGATLRVFDRWGGSVYETKGYQNNWNGTLKGKPLPVGTYFYHIHLEQGQTLTGSVSIVR